MISDIWQCAHCGQKTCIGGHNTEPFDFDYVCLNCNKGYWSCSDEYEDLKITINIESKDEA